MSSTNKELRPLPIWWGAPPSAADWARVKKAKAELDLDFLVQPGKAVPGSPGRILAIGGEPDFVCEYASVPNTSSAGLKTALSWVLGEHEDARAVTMEDSLSKIFKRKVKEVTHEYENEGAVDERTPVDPSTEDESRYRASIKTERVERSAPSFR